MRRNSQSPVYSINSRPSAPEGSCTAARSGIACIFFVAWVSSANAVGLGALDIRSYLGEPLNVRIGLITQPNEEIENACFTVINSSSAEPSINRRDVRLTLVEAKNGRYIEVRGNNPFNEPIGRLSIRAGCQSESGVVRDYSLLLDPPPLLTPTAAASTTREQIAPLLPSTAAQTLGTANPQASGESGRWTVYQGDTLSSLAAGIYPKNRARQAQYVEALRSLNPTLSGIAVNAPLPLNSQLILPDLKTLSASRTDTKASQETGLSSSLPISTSASTRRRNRTSSPRSGTEKNSAAKTNAAPISTATAIPNELPAAEARSSATATGDQKVVPQSAKSKDAQIKKQAASGFKLRISGSEMDLSRSQGVSDETRTQLRERFALLDADDQTAQLLALKNNVKQIEKRLNELQLKLAASSPSMPATGTTTPISSAATTPPAITKAETTEPSPVPVVSPPTPTASEKPAVDPAVAAKTIAPARPATPPIAPAKIAPAADSSSSDSWLNLVIAALSVVALAALAWWSLKLLRRRSANTVKNGELPGTGEEPSDDFNTWINDLETTSPTSPLPDPIAAKTDRARASRDPQMATKQGGDRQQKQQKQQKQDRQDRNNLTATPTSEEAGSNPNALGNTDSLEPTENFVADSAATVAENMKTADRWKSAESFVRDSLENGNQSRMESRPNLILDLPVSPTPLVDSFSLPDTNPTASAKATSTGRASQKAAPQNSGSFELDIDLNDLAGFPANSGDQTAEDRMRRLRYMQERYPELAARTVSIDEPESIIDAARLYYEENQLGKACELLIYSVEERPQEIRYWLAQFELFRLEKMNRQFGELADKFQLLFASSDAWPKVRDIGHELDPGNPLFAAATGTGATLNEKFDPASENWLNTHASGDTSVQHISQALVADLRASLFSEFRVTHADFQGVPDLLHASDARA